MEERSLPVILLCGPTGVGKSYLGNLISRNPSLFEVGKTLSSKTTDFAFRACSLNGDPMFPIGIIDMPGINDNRKMDELSNPKIYEKLIGFLLKNKIHVVCVLFCIRQTKTLDDDVVNHLNHLISALGSEHIENTFVTITQLDSLNDKNKRETIQILQKDLPGMLKRIDGFNPENVLMPDENQIELFINSLIYILASREPVQFEIAEINPNNPEELIKRIDILLQLRQEDALKQINSLKNQKTQDPTEIERKIKDFEEMILLIDIIQEKKSGDLSTVFSCAKECSSEFLKELHHYFTSNENSGTFKRDIEDIFEERNQGQTEMFLKKETFLRGLLDALDKNLISRVSKSLIKILQRHIVVHRSEHFRTSSLYISFNKNSINHSKFETNPSKVFGVLGFASGTYGGTTLFSATKIALQNHFSSLGAAATATTGKTMSLLFPSLVSKGAFFLALGFAGYAIKIVSWKRVDVIKDLCHQVHKIFLDPEHKDCFQHLRNQLTYICLLYVLNCLEIY